MERSGVVWRLWNTCSTSRGSELGLTTGAVRQASSRRMVGICSGAVATDLPCNSGRRYRAAACTASRRGGTSSSHRSRISEWRDSMIVPGSTRTNPTTVRSFWTASANAPRHRSRARHTLGAWAWCSSPHVRSCGCFQPRSHRSSFATERNRSPPPDPSSSGQGLVPIGVGLWVLAGTVLSVA